MTLSSEDIAEAIHNCKAVGETVDDVRFPRENASDIEPLLDAEVHWIIHLKGE